MPLSRGRLALWSVVVSAASVCWSACEKPSPSAPPQLGAPRASVVPPRAQRERVEEPRPQAADPEPLIDGCAADVALGASARKGLQLLQDACVSSMRELLPDVFVVDLRQGQKKELPFTVIEPERCLRVLAAGDDDVLDVGLAIIDRLGGELSRDELVGPLALIEKNGPICLSEPGQYRAVVEVLRGQGEIALQVYQAE